jgi:hypothetical protein
MLWLSSLPVFRELFSRFSTLIIRPAAPRVAGQQFTALPTIVVGPPHGSAATHPWQDHGARDRQDNAIGGFAALALRQIKQKGADLLAPVGGDRQPIAYRSKGTWLDLVHEHAQLQNYQSQRPGRRSPHHSGAARQAKGRPIQKPCCRGRSRAHGQWPYPKTRAASTTARASVDRANTTPDATAMMALTSCG